MKKRLLPILLLLSFAACKQDASQNNNQGSAAGSGKLQLTCEDLGAVDGIPTYGIFAIADQRKTKIMEVNSVCTEVQPASYAGYGIPEDAIAVTGSWYAGLGDFFYAKEEGDVINIYYSAIGEEGPPMGIHTYHKVATYENGKLTVLPLE